MVRALTLSLNPRAGLTYHLPVFFTANDAMNTLPRFPTSQNRNPSSQMTTVALPDSILAPVPHELHEPESVSTSPASSFSSIMSFHTITNWWSPVTSARSSSIADVNPSNYVKKYVSKESQLAKLRNRLDQERRANCRGHLQVDACRACGTGEVTL